MDGNTNETNSPATEETKAEETGVNQSEDTSVKADKKAAAKERRERWKEDKKKHREELAERYKNAPWIIRVPVLYTKTILIVLGILILLAAAGFGGYKLYQAGMEKYQYALFDKKNNEVPKEQIYELSPIDEEGAARINAYAPVGENETWAIYVYIIGADLEDYDRNQLSVTAQKQIAEEKEERKSIKAESANENLKRFTEELDKNGLALPEYLYYPNKSGPNEEYERPDGKGAASADIGEMKAADLSDNIKIIVQTGGANRWTDSMVNPNRTQRFLIDKNGMSEVSNLPIHRSNDPATVSEFLTFCKDNYPADHTMLVFWDHGGGPFGYGVDTIFEGPTMSLKEIRTALEDVYTPSDTDRAFDIIGFDACLMSNLDVTHALDGFADFYVLSAEIEPGDGWDYTPFLNEMSKNPTMSPAAVARSVADSYMDYYMTENINIGVLRTSNVCFSVLDATKSEELYQAYSELCKAQLRDAVSDNSVLADIGRCSNNSTHYATVAFDIYNLTDLGNYLDKMVDYYPEESSAADALLKEAVIYHRENGYLSDSEGISIYLPASFSSYSGLGMFLEYVYNISEDENVRNLYYYKIGGCLNEEGRKYVKSISGAEPQILDTETLRNFQNMAVTVDDKGYSVEIDENVRGGIQRYSFEVASYDEKNDMVLYYGEDEYAAPDGNGGIYSDFDGKWICMDGVPLATEIVSSSDSMIEYRSKIKHNDENAYLLFSLNKDTGEYIINGVRKQSQLNMFGEDGESFNYLVNTKMNNELEIGDKIIPRYECEYMESGESEYLDGKTIKYKKRSEIKEEGLENGEYLGMTVIYDQRGDKYYSRVVSHEVEGGKVKNRKVDDQFFGRSY